MSENEALTPGAALQRARVWPDLVGNVAKKVMKPEYVAALAVFLILSILLTGLKLAKSNEFEGDTAMFFQTVHNIVTRGVPFTNVGQSSIWAIQHHVGAMTAAQAAVDPLLPSPDPEVNLLKWHAYYVLYPIALLTLILPTPLVLLGLYVLSFTGALLLAYVLVRKRGVPIVPALLFCVLLVSYAGWAEGLDGQFFPDRLFVLGGLALIYLVSSRGASRYLQAVLAVLCASTTERGALVAGIATLAYVALYWRKADDRNFKLILGALLLGAAFVEFHSLINTENSHYMAQSLAQLGKWFADPGFFHKTELFFIVNLPLLLIALFNWRAAAIAIVIMLPNVFGTIGGNEKVGWGTSYHSYYMPILIWAAANGFAIAYARAKSLAQQALLYAGLAAAALFCMMLNPFQYEKFSVTPANIQASFIPQLIRNVSAFLGPGAPSYASVDDAIRKAVPEGSVVSAVEPAMPILYRNRTLEFFPIGVDQADYVVLFPAVQNGPGGETVTLSAPISMRGPAENQAVNEALLVRMKREGYDVDHPLVFVPPGLAVVKRVHRAARS